MLFWSRWPFPDTKLANGLHNDMYSCCTQLFRHQDITILKWPVQKEQQHLILINANITNVVFSNVSLKKKKKILCRCTRTEVKSLHFRTCSSIDQSVPKWVSKILFLVLLRQRKGKRSVQKWRWGGGSRGKAIWTKYPLWFSGIQDGSLLYWWCVGMSILLSSKQLAFLSCQQVSRLVFLSLNIYF